MALDEDAIACMTSDWKESREPPVKIFLSKATTCESEFIGWYGEFASKKALEFLYRDFVVGFSFEIGGVRFFGTTHRLSDATDQINNKRVTYNGNGKLIIM